MKQNVVAAYREIMAFSTGVDQVSLDYFLRQNEDEAITAVLSTVNMISLAKTMAPEKESYFNARARCLVASSIMHPEVGVLFRTAVCADRQVGNDEMAGLVPAGLVQSRLEGILKCLG